MDSVPKITVSQLWGSKNKQVMRSIYNYEQESNVIVKTKKHMKHITKTKKHRDTKLSESC